MALRSPTRGRATGRGRVSHKKQKKGFRPIAALARLRDRIKNWLGRQSDDLWGLALIVAAAVTALSFFDLAGPVGTGTTRVVTLLFGLWAYAIPVALCALGIALIIDRPRRDQARFAVGLGITFVGSLALFHLMTGTISLSGSIDLVRERGGAVGSLVAFPMRRIVGFWGSFVILFALTAIGTLIVTRSSIKDVGIALLAGWRGLRRLTRRTTKRPAQQRQQRRQARPVVASSDAALAAGKAPRQGPPPESKAPKSKAPGKQKPDIPRPLPAVGRYVLPPLDLLKISQTEAHSRRALEGTAAELEETLRQHGVDAKLTRIVPGPTVTRYEIELAPGVKVSRVTGLAHDIAYALATPDVRILAPIPGKSAIGVEVPNRRRHLVTLGEILSSHTAREATHPLEVGLGVDISGTPLMLNLSELPHVLIAGATGAGKSSCINAFVTSLLMRTTPEEVRMILVDPKRVELGQYNDVPHLLTKVITNPKKAADALQWAVGEMDRRYDLVADAGVRDIVGYHEKHDDGDLDPDSFDRFPYIVIVVDELNDLMMVAGRTVEESVVRIAQMARAVGIHLVLATQRPSVDVITGVIKANVPSRLAFSVASQADSRVILDTGGAEKLVGLGDMLVVTARDPKPERVQGGWVSETEIHSVVDWVREQQRAQYEERVLEIAQKRAETLEEFEGEDADIVREAMDLVVRSQLGSTSMLQRKLRLGFARAGRVMDILERRGVVGPSEGSKARTVLMTVEELEQALEGSAV